MTLVLGVDPGAHGAYALFDTGVSAQTSVWDTPTTDGAVDPVELANTLRWVLNTYYHDGVTVKAVVENVHSLPRQAGAFKFGLYTGIVHGVLAAYKIPFELVTPTEWKRGMGLLRGANEDSAEVKSRARALATQLFPALADRFKRVEDDGRAEALLLAAYYAHREKL